MHLKTSRAFTLIELLVVISIIGMLASVVLASLNNTRIKSNDTARLAQARAIQAALELYRSDYAVYPANINGDVTHDGGDRGYGDCLDTNWDDDDCGQFIPGLYGNNIRGDSPDGTVYIQRYIDPQGGDGINSVCQVGLWYNVSSDRSSYTLVVGFEGDRTGYDNQRCDNMTTNPNVACNALCLSP